VTPIAVSVALKIILYRCSLLQSMMLQLMRSARVEARVLSRALREGSRTVKTQNSLQIKRMKWSTLQIMGQKGNHNLIYRKLSKALKEVNLPFLFKFSKASQTSGEGKIVVVHRKRKFEEISNALAKEQLNRSYVYQPSNNLNKSQAVEGNGIKTDQNKRNSALTVLH
jgi:hypothetical protein